MSRILGDGSVARDPGDDAREEQQKAEALAKLNKQPRAVLSYVVGGVRMEVSLKKFMDEHNGKEPGQFDQRYLMKWVMTNWMAKNL